MWKKSADKPVDQPSLQQVEQRLQALVRASLATERIELERRAATAEPRFEPTRALALFRGPEESIEPPLGPVREHRAGPNWLRAPEGLLDGPIEAYIERDPWPLPSLRSREGYFADRDFDYWLSGLIDHRKIARTCVQYGRELRPGAAFLDLGCASGRVLRHFLTQADGLDIWGMDINERHVDWLNRYLPAPLKAVQISVMPRLPLADASLDCLSAFSVFTHVAEFELAWIAELRRVLKPGGIAYLTIHSDHTWSIMNETKSVYSYLLERREQIPGYEITPELFQSPMPEERVVFRWNGRVYDTNVFHSQAYIRRVWGRFLDVLEFRLEDSDYQDVVVLRKPLVA